MRITRYLTLAALCASAASCRSTPASIESSAGNMTAMPSNGPAVAARSMEQAGESQRHTEDEWVTPKTNP